MNESERELGLFPLGLVLLPGERLPLHIFEPKYRELIADCTLEARPFVILGSDDNERASIGCTARVDELVERFEDGRMHIEVVGEEVVEIVEDTSGSLYLTAVVRTLADEPAEDPDLAATVLAEFRSLAEQVAGAPTEPGAGPEVPTSYAVAGALELPAEFKQSLLEDRREPSRLATMYRTLSELRMQFARQRLAAERAPTNGKVSH